MNDIGFIIIGDNRYAIDKLPPFQAIEWGNRILSVLGPTIGGVMEAISDDGNPAAAFQGAFGQYKSAEASQIMRDAMKRCYTPQNESLGNEAVFNSWFREHSGDLFHLGVMAVWELTRDFLPKQLITFATAFRTRMQSKAAQGSPSPMDGKQEPGQDAQ